MSVKKKITATVLSFIMALGLLTGMPVTAAAESNDATLFKVAGQTIAPGNETGTDSNPITAAVTVPYSKSSITATDLTPTDAGATVNLYSDSNFSTEEAVTLTGGGTSSADTDIYVKVSSADAAATLYYKITVTRVASDAPVITHRTLPDGMAGFAYSDPFISLNGQIPYTGRQIVTGALPDGLSNDTTSNGSSDAIIIMGTPTAAGTFAFAITVTNGSGKTSAPVEFSITILADNRETVSFGGKEWLVIGDGASGIAPVADTLTLLSKNHVFGTSQFHSSSSKYSGSDLQAAMGTALTSLHLSSAERGLIEKRTLTGSGEVYSTVTEMAGADAENQEFWPLSNGEYYALPSDYYRTYATYWWLRSPGGSNSDAIIGYASGSSAGNNHVHDTHCALRPAFYLNLSSVIFTSAAAGGKSGSAGANLSTAQSPANFYKFTMADHSVAPAFALDSVSNAGGALTVNYTGAAYVGGQTRTISAIVKDSGGNVTHYGKLKDITGVGDESGVAAVTLPGGFDPADDTLYIFVEQHNGDNYTDFAGTPIAISNDASLVSVAGQAITAVGDGMAAATPKTAAITVANSVGSIALTDIAAATGATVEVYSDAVFSQDKNQSISLNGGGNHLYIKVTAQDGVTVVYYDVTVNRSLAPVYALGVSAGTGGSVSGTAGGNYEQGHPVSVTATANSGYRFTGWTVSGITLSSSTVNPAAFSMPANGVTLTADFEAKAGGSGGTYIPPASPVEPPATAPGDSAAPSPEDNPFTDVKESDWFYDDVIFVYTHSLMAGTSENPVLLFSPRISMSRAMLVTVLHRMAGSPVTRMNAAFDDVTAGKWYYEAVNWAAESGIVSGVGGNNFAPDSDITREQMAAILAGYARFMDIDLSKKRNGVFTDETDISAWAKEAVNAMYAAGILSGKPGNLFDPKITATRAEVAAMLHRFIVAAGGEEA